MHTHAATYETVETLRFKGFTWPAGHRLSARQVRHWYPFLARFERRGLLRRSKNAPATEEQVRAILAGRDVESVFGRPSRAEAATGVAPLAPPVRVEARTGALRPPMPRGQRPRDSNGHLLARDDLREAGAPCLHG